MPDDEQEQISDKQLAAQLRARLNVDDNNAVLVQMDPYLRGLAKPGAAEGYAEPDPEGDGPNA